MKTTLRILLTAYLIGINIYAALEMLQDKRNAEYNGLVQSCIGKNEFDRLKPITYAEFHDIDKYGNKTVKLMRTPEKFLFRISLAGGAIGVEAAMYYLKHKTANSGFTQNIPVHIGINILVFGTLLFLLRKKKKKDLVDYGIY